jgi:rubrerythrin
MGKFPLRRARTKGVCLAERTGIELRPAGDGWVQFTATGEPAFGEYQCSECGYGVTVSRVLPRCPMCGGTSWEHSARRFTREQRP